MSEHTKEPWFTAETDDGFIEITNDERADKELISITEISTGFSGQVGIEQEANARRIVACVNACAGLSTDLLIRASLNSDHIFGRERISHYTAKIEQQLDKLLAVCEELSESAAYWSEYDVPIGIVDRLNAAIDEVKGNAA